MEGDKAVVAVVATMPEGVSRCNTSYTKHMWLPPSWIHEFQMSLPMSDIAL